MNSIKMMKFALKSSERAVLIFYSIFIGVGLLIGLSGNAGMSGIEMSGMIFLFVIAICIVKEGFIFAMANNVTRGEFFKGILLALTVMSIGMSFLAAVFNRVFNIFFFCPSLYDMGYGGYNLSRMGMASPWVKPQGMDYFFKEVLFVFAIYVAASALGVFIKALYERANTKVGKVLACAGIPIAMNVLGIYVMPNMIISKKVMNFLYRAMGLSEGSVYAPVILLILMAAIFVLFSYLLLRKVEVK